MDDKTLEDALVLAVHEIFDGSREELSVNNVRKQCESKHGLEEGFFASAEWKLKSKTIIKGRVVSLLYPLSTSYVLFARTCARTVVSLVCYQRQEKTDPR